MYYYKCTFDVLSLLNVFRAQTYLHKNEYTRLASCSTVLIFEFFCVLVALDLAFVVDGSNNVGSATFTLLMKFIKAIYHTLPVSGKGVHIGMVTFGDQGNMVFNFRQHRTISDLDLAVNQLQLPGGSGNNAGAGLTVAHAQVFGGSGRKHKKVKKAMVTILVGKSDDDVVVQIKKIKSEDIISIIIGINSDTGQANLIASSPDHQLLLTDPRQLMDFIDKVIEMLNKGNQSYFI